jgi:uncharacterized oxidoreductase
MAEFPGTREVDEVALTDFLAKLFESVGTASGRAHRVASALVDADRCGHSSHGARQAVNYLGQIRRGELDVEAEPLVVESHKSRVTVDGRFGFGHLTAEMAVDLALDRAREQGMSVVSVRNANHIGRLGAYTTEVAEQGCIALMFVNAQGTSHVQVAPFGGLDKRLTNNPVSIAVPGGPMLDMALSNVAENRVFQARNAGRPVPDGWIVDADGTPTNDPNDYVDGGTLVPLGGADFGYKGYAMIVLTDVLVGLLTRGGMAGAGRSRFSNAFVLICIDPGTDGREGYLAELTALVDWIKSSRRRAGVSDLLIPGEPEARSRERIGGVLVDVLTLKELTEAGRSVGVTPEW